MASLPHILGNRNASIFHGSHPPRAFSGGNTSFKSSSAATIRRQPTPHTTHQTTRTPPKNEGKYGPVSSQNPLKRRFCYTISSDSTCDARTMEKRQCLLALGRRRDHSFDSKNPRLDTSNNDTQHLLNKNSNHRSQEANKNSHTPVTCRILCGTCAKPFLRRIDFDRHMQTHSRPYKCPKENCEYFELGWPTEEERDRHVNDKHSTAPPQYKCLYPPCTYASKRESNCKQHMEKAHGWEYVRSKHPLSLDPIKPRFAPFLQSSPTFSQLEIQASDVQPLPMDSELDDRWQLWK